MDGLPTSDGAVGFGLLVTGAAPALALGSLFRVAQSSVGTLGWFALGTVATVWAAMLCPAGYKLLRYPSTRTVSLGRLVSELRRGRLGALRSGLLVSFSGIDGAGKTTQAERLIEEFEAIDVPAVHVWARWRPFVSYPLMGVLYVLFGWRRKDYHRSRTLRHVWGYLVALDQLIFFSRHLLVPLLRGKVVFVDRYLLDQLVELEYDGLYNPRAATLLRRLLPSPERTVLMEVPVETALDRKDDTQEMLDRLHIDTDARTYLERRQELYRKHAADVGHVTRVDTSRPIEETNEELRDSLFDTYFRF
ncbi:dTMP kinase [Haloplanus pelagicus]|uniref:dTMP kinase n=1 Tax=Haloplanus pelagicus TaxID=2949995 RepID=UPI00203CC285|nr:hypothetical protein [Haloplanus sp. HW8-1]